MTVERLLHALEGIEIYFCGAPNMEVYACEPWDESAQSPLSPTTLYVAPLEKARDYSDNMIGVASVDLQAALDRLRAGLARDYRSSELLLKLTHVVADHSALALAADLCSSVLEHAVFFWDENFNLAASSRAEELRRFMPQLLSQLQPNVDAPLTLLPSVAGCPCEALLGSIYSDGKITGYIMTADWKGKLALDEAKYYIRKMSIILSGYDSFQNKMVSVSPKYRFLLELLQGELIDLELVEQRKKELAFPVHDKYYVVSVNVKTNKNLTHIQDQLHKILKEEVYSFKQHYFAIIGCDLKDRISEQTYPEMQAFLASNGLYLGMSNGFLDYVSVRAAFEQSINAAVLRRQISDNIYFCRYEDLLLTHLLAIANSRGFSYESFCHPNVIYVERYDREQGTEYLKTLLTYVFNNMRLSETADKLFIHRNTLYHRINVLREQFGIDFENPREIMKLQIACTAYGATGGVKKPEKLFGPMN